MKRKLLAASALLALQGCAAPGYEGQLQSWTGRTSTELVDVWGEPGDVLTDGQGRTVLVYTTVRTETRGGTSTSATDPITGQRVSVSAPTRVETFWCKTSFTLDQDETVAAYAYDGNDCAKN